ncbi:MAG: hydroxyacid dehydrogenase [Chloroflexi bacterium]|nr:hydroxyacid dehydrogenase [Chloroflexota bacterium]
MKAVYLLPERSFNLVYGPDEQRDIAARVTLAAPRLDPKNFLEQRGSFDDVEAIFSSWGMPPMDAAFFEVFPQLRVLFYGAGAVNAFVTDETWAHGVQISNANVANGAPVAEFTVAQIMLALKQTWRIALQIKHEKRYVKLGDVAGGYHSTVGLISLGAIGRMVAERLRSYDVDVVAYDPHAPPDFARDIGVTLVPLEDVFTRADVISCHTPWLPETEGMINDALLRSMKHNATFINTARGAVVNEPELIAVLRDRPDLFALLDVTWPEPPADGSPLYELPNVMLTPHIAGSMSNECRRMGRVMIDELDRWQHGEPLRFRVNREYARGRG